MTIICFLFSPQCLVTCCDAKTTHTLRFWFVSTTSTVEQKPNTHRWKSTRLSLRLDAAVFIAADVFARRNTSAFTACFINPHSHNQTLCQKGEPRRLGGEVRFTPFVLACWDQWLWSPSCKLTDGTLLREPQTGQSSWFLIGHERQSATPVTAGHGHHHTSGTWGHKGD